MKIDHFLRGIVVALAISLENQTHILIENSVLKREINDIVKWERILKFPEVSHDIGKEQST